MVLSFFRRGDDPLEHIEQEIAAMLRDCRHSFDLATSALIADADVAPIGEEVRATDRRINGTEEAVRRELVVHTAVHGGADVAMVLASLLIVKKLERAGDQTKNIFDLADEGVRFSGDDDYEDFLRLRNEVSSMMGNAVTILEEADEEAATRFVAQADDRQHQLDALVNALMHSVDPAHRAVPRAMFYRYCKRIIANVSGVVATLTRPLDRGDPDE